MKKRVLAIALALCMAAVPLSGTAFAQDTEGLEEERLTVGSCQNSAAADFSFERVGDAEYSGTCGENLTYKLNTGTGVLTISGTGSMGEDMGYPWRIIIGEEDRSKSVKNVVIESGVTTIGSGAFYDCSALETISIPDSVVSIEGSAFSGCEKLQNVAIPGSVTSIGFGAFSGCSSLKSVIIPDSVINLGEQAFIRCSGLTTITLSDGITSLGNHVFFGCSSLTGITIPGSITSLGDSVFGSCSSLTDVTIPDTVTSMGDTVFVGCSSLKSVTLPAGITSINFGMFGSCSALTSIVIPDGVTTIGNNAFEECSSLKSAVIPGSITGIGNAAFYGCLALTDVYYSGSKSEWNAITIDGSNHSLTSAAIHYNSGMPESGVVSGECGAEGSDVLWIFDPNTGTLTIRGTGAMAEMPEVFGNGETWGGYTDSVKTIVIEKGVTRIGGWMFSDCSNLIEVQIPESVNGIGQRAFEKCSKLESINIPYGVTAIGQGAFAYCSSLKSINIPNSVAGIGAWASYGCNSLTDIYYAGSKDEWQEIPIASYNNDPLLNATIHYGVTEPDNPPQGQPLADAVQYVPYSAWLSVTGRGGAPIDFVLSGGKLPDGLSLSPEGEIYGVPTGKGDFAFSVEANGEKSAYTLKVKDSTENNVNGQVDSGFRILQYVPRVVTTLQDYIFRCEGEYADFVDFWLDGIRLTRDVDYEVHEGSTVITIFAQTFRKYGSGDHTIAAEFRVGGVLKRAVQKYTLDLSAGSDTDGDDGENSGGFNSSGSGSGGSSSSGGSAALPERDELAAATRRAIRQLEQNAARLIVKLRNANYIPLRQLQEITAAAREQGKEPWLNVDTVPAGQEAVDVRVGLDPALAKEGKYMAASTRNFRAKRTRALFEKHFSNRIAAVVHLSQQKDFDQTAVLCVQIPEEIRTEQLTVYAYDRESNTYRRIMEPNAWLDANQYLHFDCPYGGDIVLSVGALTKK